MPLEDPAAVAALTSAAGIAAVRTLWVKRSSRGFHCLGLNTAGLKHPQYREATPAERES